MKIVEYESYSNIIVEFQDEFRFRKKVAYTNFKVGGVKNPYDRNKYGVGYIGYGKHKSDINGQYNNVYDSWSDMLNRCYHNKKKYPAYYGVCTVCDEWLDFQVFAEWYENHKYEVEGRLHLDKDILYPGCNLYSPKTCLLVPQRINELFCVSTRKKDGLPQGIRKTDSERYNTKYGGKNLGTYNTYEEACSEYIVAKKNKIIEVANEYKDIIPIELYNALVNYEVKIAV